jgi:hypothetical protein
VADFPECLRGSQAKWSATPANPGLPTLRFADETLFRTYRNEVAVAQAQVYLIYSHTGQDRKHHPEFCLRDAQGLPEDVSWRRRVPLGAASGEVCRYRFRTGTGHYTFVYYWYYTLPPASAPGQTPLQLIHWRLGRPVPSLTVLVCSDVGPERLAPVEQELLRAVDAALIDRHLPATAHLSCDPLPIHWRRVMDVAPSAP